MSDKNNLNGVCFSNAVKVCKEFQKDLGGSVALISRDSDYFALAKEIKDDFEDRGVTLKNIVLDDSFSPEPNTYLKLFCFSEDVSLIIAVGNAELINLARFFATMFKIQLIAVPTEIAFMTIFSKSCYLINEKLPELFSVQVPDLCVIDLPFLAGLKKQAFADAYCEVASKSIAFLDYKVDCILNNRDSKEIDEVFNILTRLTKIDSEGNACKISIINAQLSMGLFLKTFGEFSANEKSLAYILSTQKENSQCENAFFVNKPLIKLYELFLRVDTIKTRVSPDYNEHVSELANLLNSSELEIIKKYKPLEFDDLISKRQALIDSGFLSLIRKVYKLNEKLEDNYKYVYKGRQKRAGFSIAELKTVLKLSSYIYDGGLLKLLNDSGMLECL